MAILAIPNPTKSLTVDFPIEGIKKGLKRLYLLTNKYRLESSNEVFNQYKFAVSEALSFGAYVDVHLSAIDGRTQIAIEVSRKVGTFDQSHEVTAANQHIANMIDFISKATVMTDEEADSIIARSNEIIEKRKNRKFKKRYILYALLIGFIAFCVYVINFADVK